MLHILFRKIVLFFKDRFSNNNKNSKNQFTQVSKALKIQMLIKVESIFILPKIART